MIRKTLVTFLFILMTLCPFQVNAQDRALHWQRYDVVVAVQSNGDLRMTETQILDIDSGTFRFGTETFKTGQYGRVSDIQVSEDGQNYEKGSNNEPGTYSASDDGEQFNVRYNFRDATATSHTITIAYTVARALVLQGDQVQLQWNFFCSTSGCPKINDGSVTLQYPTNVPQSQRINSVSGVTVDTTQTDNTTRWDLQSPIQGKQLNLTTRFPRTVLLGNATFRVDTGSIKDSPGQQTSPSAPASKPTSTAGVLLSLFFCLFVIVILFFMVWLVMRILRGLFGGRSSGSGSYGPDWGMPSEDFSGRRRWGRRRRGRGWDSGWGTPGIPPIIFPPGDSGRDTGPRSWDDSPGGGGSSWGDSDGGGSSWGDSGGGGSSWGSSSSGGGSSWGSSSSGGGSSWGGSSGGSSSGGGGGSDNSSGFG